MFFVLLLSVAITLISSAGGYKEVTIGTKLGRLKGIERSVLGKTLHEFRRIPFAKAPVGNLRFEKPKLFGSWNGTLDGTSFGPSCYQVMGVLTALLLQNKNISEDCLFLNIQVPTPLSARKSVMIWIHGGGYHEGQAPLYDGGHLAVIGDVIVVTVNYRLNVFGFLSTGVLKGNYGLWDQIMAIQWIKENIAAFGGDNQSITVFGESAGAFSVGLLALMPSNQGLFQRVILQSGVANTPYAINTQTKHLSISIAEHSNCTTSNNHVLVKCLKDKTAEELFQVYKTLRYKHPNLLKIPLTPVVDDELLPSDPLNILHDIHSSSNKFFRSLDVMIGTVTGEASLMIQGMRELQELYRFNITHGIPKRVLTTFIAPTISAQLFNNVSRVTSAIIEKYGQWTDETNQTRDTLNVYSDVMFNIPAVQLLQIHAANGNKNGRLYQYLFSRKPPITFFQGFPDWFTQPAHAVELMFQFSNQYMNQTVADENLSRKLIKYWTNFAKSGDVNGPDLPLWPKYDTSTRYYINLDANITTGQHFIKDRVTFWLEDIPNMAGATSDSNSVYRLSVVQGVFIFCYFMLQVFL